MINYVKRIYFLDILYERERIAVVAKMLTASNRQEAHLRDQKDAFPKIVYQS